MISQPYPKGQYFSPSKNWCDALLVFGYMPQRMTLLIQAIPYANPIHLTQCTGFIYRFVCYDY